MQTPRTALLVEDDPQIAAALRSQLLLAGFVVHEAGSERDALRCVEEIAPDVVILDLALEGRRDLDGLQPRSEGLGERAVDGTLETFLEVVQ